MVEANITHHETVTLDGAVHTGPNVEGDCARALIGARVEPGELLVFSRNGVPALRGTVAAFAGRAWGGADADPQFRRWRPHPKVRASADPGRPAPAPRRGGSGAAGPAGVGGCLG